MECFYFLPILWTLFSHAAAQQNPTITFISKETVADIGGTVELKCSVQFVKKFPVMWIRLPDTPLSFHGARIVPDNRYTIRYDESTMSFLLQIQDLQESDEGLYQCQVQVTSSNKVTAEVPLSIRRPPVISDDSTRDVIVGRGEDVALFCNATGNPHPKVSWRRQGKGVLPTGAAIYHGSDLKIFDIQKEHRGTYVCEADNSVGKGDRRAINVRVEFSPLIRIPRERVGQAMFNERELECIVEGFPTPQVEWIFTGRKIVSDQHYEVASFAVGGDVSEMKLRIKNIQKNQFGVYQCIASNKLGSATGKLELYESSRVVGDYNDRNLLATTTLPVDTGRDTIAMGLTGGAPAFFSRAFPLQPPPSFIPSIILCILLALF